MIIKKAVLLLTLAVTTQLAMAQCANEEMAKASLAATNAEIEDARAVNDSAITAVLAQVEANGAKLKWNAKRRGDFVQQLMKDPAFVRAEEGKKEHLKKISAVQEELAKFTTNPEVTVLCSLVVKMREPFAAITRLNEEQVEVMKAAVAAMKR